jgi:hypothetical protein
MRNSPALTRFPGTKAIQSSLLSFVVAMRMTLRKRHVANWI